MKESTFQHKLITALKERLPGSVILKTDPTYIQGFPDLVVLYKKRWCALEVKNRQKASHRPNQDYWVNKLNKMSYASFVYPENLEDILNGISKSFKPGRNTRISGSK